MSTESASRSGDLRPPRALNLADVVGLGVNCVIGSGIFLLPGLVADGLGPASLLAVLVAGILACLVALCFAEAGARVTTTGGAYAYARAAFGDLVSFQVGWIATVAGTIAWAALVSAFAVALTYFVPMVATGAPRVLTILGLLLMFAAINIRGVVLGARTAQLFTLAKIGALVAFAVTGAFFVDAGRFVPFAPFGFESFGSRVLLILYAYVGFENLVVPAGEIAEPERALPRAITAIMLMVTVLYLAVQAVAIGTLDGLEGTRNAVAAAAEAFLGPAGGAAIAGAVLLSVLGVNAASALVLPRRLFALAEGGQLPRGLARLHTQHRTPWVAVVVTYILVGIVALSGSFRELAEIAVVARFLQYAPTCLAVLVLRRRDRQAGKTHNGFQLPWGPLIPIAALAMSGVLLLAAGPRQLLVAALALLSGVPFYWWHRRREAQRG